MKAAYEFIKNEDEKQFVKMIMQLTRKADQQYRPFFTDFYDAGWIRDVSERYLTGYDHEMLTFFGGYEDAERQIIGICPYALQPEAYEISVLQVTVKTGIGRQLTHRDFLGAVLGLGIERKLIGDIIIKPFGAYVIVKENIASYIRSQLVSIGRYQKIEIQETAFDRLQAEKPKIKEVTAVVSSLRADAVAASCFGLSRSECARLIQGEKLRCNGCIKKSSDLIKEGDILTLRGYGKARLATVNGQTKKERLHITIEKYI